MLFLDLTLPTPAKNLALDEALLNQAEQAARSGEDAFELLRFWESPVPFVALGSTGRLAEVEVEACRREGVPVFRRSSGGGTVFGGPGCLCFALILSLDQRPELRDIHESYRVILGRIAECLGVPGLAHRGICDLAVGDRKVSGNAQRRKSRVLLHHGTILHGADLPAMARLLKEPACRPAYRGRRIHSDFTTNLALSSGQIRERLIQGWGADTVREPLDLPDVSELMREKYGNPEWTRRF